MILKQIIFGCIVALVISISVGILLPAEVDDKDKTKLENIKFATGLVILASFWTLVITIAYGCLFVWFQ